MFALQFLIALTLAISASARPAETEKRWGGWGAGGRGQFGGQRRQWWQPSKASSYLDFGKRWDGSFGTCDMNNALGAMNLGSGMSRVDLSLMCPY